MRSFRSTMDAPTNRCVSIHEWHFLNKTINAKGVDSVSHIKVSYLEIAQITHKEPFKV